MNYQEFYEQYKKILADIPRITAIIEQTTEDCGVIAERFPIESVGFTVVGNGIYFDVYKKFNYEKISAQFVSFRIPDIFFFADDSFIREEVIKDLKKQKLGKFAENGSTC